MKSKLQKIIALLSAFCMAASLAGCGTFSLSAEEREVLAEDEAQVVIGQSIGQELAATYAADQIFSLNCVSDTTYNPSLTSSAWNRVVAMLVYETLVVQDENFEAQPNLITSWSSEDGQTWTFTVDTERTFHDGGSMTAMDAMYSLTLAMNYDGPYTTRFRYVREIYTDGEGTLVVILNRTNWRFYELMNIPCVEYDSGFRDMPPGTGPYEFSSSGRYLTLVKEHPLASQMPLDTIHLKEYSAAVDILQAFEDSYIDLVINDPTGISSLGYSSTNIIKYVNTSNMHYLGYNMYSTVFGQALYRQLVTYAIDRNTIVAEVMKGAATAATVPVAPQSPLYPGDLADTLAYSETGLATAIENLGLMDVDQDGYWELFGAPYTIDFIVCSDSGTKVAAARSIAKKMQDAGFAVELRELGFDEYTEALKKGEYDMYYAEVRLCDDWDLSLLLSSGADLNFGDVRDGTLDGDLVTFLSTDGEEFQTAARELYMYISQNAYITPICFEKSEVLYHRGVLSGLNPTQDNIFYGMENWTVELN
jgi:peptide/nickel transport system substrate-binding protein